MKEDQNSEEILLETLMDPAVSKKTFITAFMTRVQKQDISLDDDLATPSGNNDGQKLDTNRERCVNACNEFSKKKQKVKKKKVEWD